MSKIFILLISFYVIQVQAEIKALNRQGQKIDFSKYSFTDDSGKAVNLADYFQPKKPVFLAPVYFACPGMCTLTLNQMFANLQKLKFNPGKALEVIAFSINPQEKPSLALQKKNNYLKRFKYENASSGFHFLTGDQEQITALTNELGFKFEQNREEFYHPSAVYLLTPNGQIAKIFNGKETSVKKLHEYVYQAAHGKKLSSYEKMLLSCKPEDKALVNK